MSRTDTFQGLGYKKLVLDISTSTRTVLAEESGATFTLSRAAGSTLTLPAAATGLNYKFVVGVVLTGGIGYVIPSNPASKFFGPHNDAAGVAGGNAAGETTFTFVNDAALVGDFMETVSDGTNWYIFASARTAASITCA